MSALPISDSRVAAAMAAVDRLDFLPSAQRAHAREDRPLDIGSGQTTSQPSLIGWMLSALQLPEHAKVLEVGTGCGYQTALLSQFVDKVFSIDIVPELVAQAEENLQRVGVANAVLRVGDGHGGWPEEAPFDGIVVAAGAPSIPAPLVAQLRVGGKLVVPVGQGDAMRLWLLTRTSETEVKSEPSFEVRFVPLTGPQAEADRRERAGEEPRPGAATIAS